MTDLASLVGTSADDTSTSTDTFGVNAPQYTPPEISDLGYALDTHAAYAGDRSLLDNFSDVVTKGIPLTGLAVVNSFANTGIELANVFGADVQKWSIDAEAPEVEAETGTSGLADYYHQHEAGIEGSAFLIGSLAPGMAGIKAFRAGTAALDAYRTVRAGEASNIISRATGLLPSVYKKELVEKATQEITSPDAVFNMLTKEKVKAIAADFGDQALEALAYQTATVATMKASPLLDDKSLGDLAQDTFYGMLTGAAIGGVLNGVRTNGQINKLIQGVDDATKQQQLIRQTGIGAFSPGDRVNTTLAGVWDRPAPDSGLGSTYAKMSTDAAILKAKGALGELVDNGDEELTNSLFDSVIRMKNSGSVSADDAYQTFGRLAKVTRITDETVPEIDDGTFFVNKRVQKIGQNSATSWNDLVTPKASSDAQASLRYQLQPGRTNVKYGTALDTFIDVNGNKAQLYKNSDEAWNDGVDLFVNPKGDILVNPRAPNIMQIPRVGESRPLGANEDYNFRTTAKLPKEGSKPLLGTQVSIEDKPGATIFNVNTGAITDKATPFVGDFGKVQWDNGKQLLRFGSDKTVGFGTVLNAETDPVTANALFVSAWKRGIRPGDDINGTDIHMLEQLYREGIASGNFGEAMNKFTKKNVFIDGDILPDSPQDLLGMIKDAKDDLLTTALEHGTDATSAARIANVPEQYIENGFKASKPEDYMLDPSKSAKVNHVSLWYDIGSLNTQDGNILRGIQDTQYRVQLINAANKDVATRFLGEKADDFFIKGDASQAGIKTAPGGGFLKTSSANYATFGQQFERVGRLVQTKVSEAMSQLHATLFSPADALRKDPVAAAEAGMFRAVRQRTGENYAFLPEELEQKYLPEVSQKLGLNKPTGTIAVLDKALIRDDAGNIKDFNAKYIPQGFVDGLHTGDPAVPGSIQEGLRSFYYLSPKVAAWESANQSINDARIGWRNNFMAANGIQKTIQTGTLYTPPVNTAKYPFFAYLKARPGTGMADDSVAVITARTAEDLRAKIAQVADKYSVYTKTGSTSLKEYHEVEGDYLYNRNFASNRVSNDLARQGILNDVFPETRGENIIQDYLDWHQRQVTGLVRDHVEIGNGQLFAELRGLGDRFSSTETSQTGFVPSRLGRQAENPYQDYINTALNISSKEQYKTWSFANEVLESTFGTAFDALKSGFQSAQKGIIPYEKAADLAEQFGLGKVYENGVNVLKNYYNIANKLPQPKYLSRFVSAANGILGQGIIRLDAYQSLIHAISTPMLAAIEATSAKSQLKQALATDLPGVPGVQIPGTAKLVFNAVSNWWKDDVHAQYADLYSRAGTDPSVVKVHRQLMDELALPFGDLGESVLVQKIKKASDIGGKLSLSDYTNNFNHFIAADVGRQIFEAAGFSGKDLFDQVMTFSNRVQGNYIAGQRPVVFQGPLGQAVGLFQTYYLNMMQNLSGM